MMFTAAESTRSSKGEVTLRLYLPVSFRVGYPSGCGWQQSEGHAQPRTAIDTAVGEDLSVLGKLQFRLHQSIGELAGIDREWTDVACNLIVRGRVSWRGFTREFQAPAKDDLEDARAAVGRRAVQEGDEMRIDGDGHGTRSGHREHHASDVDARTWTRGLPQGEIFDEER